MICGIFFVQQVITPTYNKACVALQAHVVIFAYSRLMKFVRLTTTDNSYEANFLKEDLEGEGIPSFLTNENITNLVPNTVGLFGAGIQVMVPEEAYERAKAVLQKRQQVMAVMRCPHCDSMNVRFGLGSTGWLRKTVAVVMSLIAWIPFGNIRNTYYCDDCQFEFKK